VSKLALISAKHRQNKLERKKERKKERKRKRKRKRKGIKNSGIWDERKTHTETTKGAMR